MGLAGVKRRRKLADDPNNTKWARNAESFGQRMLRSHGWEPGQYLGAKDAAHAVHHTAANASPIRVLFREDNLGVGAKRNGTDECTGLDAFQDLLGRLNGKDEGILETERKRREELKLSLYVQQKLGTMRFVAGGLLVGNEVQQLQESEQSKTGEPSAAKAATDLSLGSDDDSPDQDSMVQSIASESHEFKAKKRKGKKLKQVEEGTFVQETLHEPLPKVSGEKYDQQSATEPALGIEEAIHSQKRKKKSQRSESEAAVRNDDDPESKARRKARKERKEKKRLKESAVSGQSEDSEKTGERVPNTKQQLGDSGDDGGTTGTASPTPVRSGTSTPSSQAPTRHISRQRFIAQKRLSVLDPQALNQIFMIKSTSS